MVRVGADCSRHRVPETRAGQDLHKPGFLSQKNQSDSQNSGQSFVWPTFNIRLEWYLWYL